MPRILWLIPPLSAVFAGCSSPGSAGKQQISYQPLKDYPMRGIKLDSGTALTILGFSGGEGKDTFNYYYSFLAINNQTGDTIRILSALIALRLPGDEPKETFSPAYANRLDKGVRNAIFGPVSNNQDFILELVSRGVEKPVLNRATMLENQKHRASYVVVNKSFHLARYPLQDGHRHLAF